MADLAGKVAIVTGALGIALAAARKLAEDGASVVVCSDREDQVKEAMTALREENLEVRGLRANVTSSVDARGLVDFAVESYGGVDILVNAAGVQRYGTVVDTDEGVWDEVLNVNLKGIYLVSKHAIPEMSKRGGGSIVNVSSVQAFASQKGVAAYTASKGGVNALTRAMALDHAHENIRVNAVCPASVDTPMLRWSADLFKGEKTLEETLEGFGKMHPLGRVARAEEVAGVISFLAGPEASFVTGGEYKVDGGMLAALGVQLPE
ncbi:MAG: glucose 1-dehydrogenase [Actinomycetota bacterium]|nr:glucose 1-dehydrogenase [Actinomycetota bacterium]